MNYTKIKIVFFAILASPMIFLAFKEGFVRLDAPHMALFYSQLLLLALIFLLVSLNNGIKLSSFSNKLLISVILISCCLSPNSQFSNLKDMLLVFDKTTKLNLLSAQKRAILQEIEINHIHQDSIKEAKNVDIIPTNISLLYALNANWKPRPIMQSYSVYTSTLSQLNGQYYTSSNAPTYIIMNYFSIDNRYPLFDEPNLFHSLLTNYALVANYSNSYLLFKRRLAPIYTQKLPIGHVTYTLGKTLTIPRIPNKNTFMSAKIDLTLLGKLMAIIYKVPPLTMTFVTDKQVFSHRIIRRTLTEDVLVSSYIGDLNDIESLIKQKEDFIVSKINIEGNPLFYQNQASINFTVW